ncbi:hypothetical protein FSP39_005292 [Pinctada imbricata]|uniref:Uncharacterized protein n=1 Tax=Pinctada imbricata TaxID=66713 RepID=A0AA89BU31_PINIB|nr:hypothetical protein FSP39_005292 [Pinctada imbricata]
MLITLNEGLDKVNRLNQRRHWKECIDEDDVLRPDYILKLFNRGLTNTCQTLRQESWKKKLEEEFGCDIEIATITQPDSTICIHIYIKVGDGNDRKPLDINIVPTLSITKLPRQIRIRTPFPNRQKYFEQKDKFEKDVLSGIKKGEMLCLEACVWTQSHSTRMDKKISYTWNVSCSSLEDKGLQCISEVISPEALENIILLIRKIRKEHLMGLNPLTNQMVQNAVFHVHRKNIGTFMSDDQWFLEVIATIAAQLRHNYAPSFFLNSRNLLDGWEMRFVQWMGNELQRVHCRIKERPQLLDYYVGAKSMFDEDDEADNEQDDVHGNSLDANEKVDLRG